MSYTPAEDRYNSLPYRRTGRSGLKLPELSLGLWHNFGEEGDYESQRAIVRRAFDHGITHFDLANNYGPPPGSSERRFGQMLREDFSDHRDELVISSKAGWDMWPGPYGSGGGGRKYLLASLDQSLERLGLDYVDIFYSHRPDPDTPLEETMGALDTAVRSGKALYVGISSYSAEDSRRAAEILRDLGTPLLIHQPSYSMLNRWIETQGLLDTAEELGFGVIGFSALAQGMLSSRYLNGIPEGSRASRNASLKPDWLNETNLTLLRALNDIARERGQSLSQLALQWALRDERMTSLVIGASSVAQLDENVGAVSGPPLTQDVLDRIDSLATDAGIDLWAGARDGGSINN
ncbi:L-glyceraldehyde 3-phosphate reductase [Humidisolicoccus flavus]|uniref:L-glyceraldehyde 3-phosphate reductase n=1 Tax=Humidisolicoccus flavus TaxID=3111414 RepID=UPI00324E0EA1